MPANREKILQDFAQVIAYAAPVRCCASWEECLKSEPENNLVWCRSHEQLAGADAAFARLALNRERSKTNPTGGGPKQAWYPSREGWYALATLVGDLAAAELPSGVYCLSFADAAKNPLAEEGRATLRFPDEEGAGGAATAGKLGPAAEPKLAQHHLEELHQVGLKYRQLDLNGVETQAQSTRAILELVLRMLNEQQTANAAALTTIKTGQDVNLGQAEAAGKILQMAHVAIEQGTKLVTAAQGPPAALLVRAIGAEVRGMLQEAQALYILRQQGRLPAPGSSQAGSQIGPAGGDPMLEAARLRAENEALKELARLRAENQELRARADTPPKTPPEEPAAGPILDAEVVRPGDVQAEPGP